MWITVDIDKKEVIEEMMEGTDGTDMLKMVIQEMAHHRQYDEAMLDDMVQNVLDWVELQEWKYADEPA